MTYYYSCKLKHNNFYKTILIETDKIFPNQFNKKHLDQYEELVDLAFVQLIKQLRPFQICPLRSDLTLICYEKLTKRDIEFARDLHKFEEEWFDSEEYEDEEEWHF